MINLNAMFKSTPTDADLVARSLAGERDAYGAIVTRYQNLICSLAYSATGSISQSQDLAQDVFLAAWKELASLREPQKLRSWLCTIARHRITDTLRRQGREPSHHAAALDSAHEVPGPEPLPPDHTISKEEEAILWRSIERIPESYREPLVLFYREHQSIEKVAEALDLSEEAVRQRLSRGRKLLQEQVLAFLEGTLERTSPGKQFTLGVLAALPVFTASAQTAAIGATAAKGGAVAKSAGLLGPLNAILGPVVMFFAVYLGYKLDFQGADSPQRRALVVKVYRLIAIIIGVFFLAVLAASILGGTLLEGRPGLRIAIFGGLGATYVLATIILNVWMRRSLRRIRRQEGVKPLPTPVFEYRSKAAFLGLPLVHIRIRGGMERGPVKAWIAIGDSAIGGLFAFGGYAIAPIPVGGIAVGLAPFGGFALGPVALGGFSLAIWSIGGFAAGWQAFGGFALAWESAMGAAAFAREVAMGAVAQAAHANDAIAKAHIETLPFFAYAQQIVRHLVWVNLLWVAGLAFLVLKRKPANRR